MRHDVAEGQAVACAGGSFRKLRLMRLSKLVRATAVAFLGFHVLVNGLTACSDDDDDRGSAGAAGSAGVDIDDVRYATDEVTDEAVESILGVTATVDDTKAPLVSSPAEGATLPNDKAPTFTWTASTASLAPSLRLVPGRRGSALPAWLGPERSAHAHGTPFTGVAYVLTFATATDAHLVRVATDETSYTPDDDAWAALKKAGSTITVTLTAARLESNLVSSGGGPFTSSKGVSFTIAP